MEKHWLRRNIPDEGLVDALMSEIKISSVLATLMAQRNITGISEAKSYFNPHPSQLHDPFLMLDMEAAIARIEQAVANEEKILFYGDYDVDGTTSVALMALYFKDLYKNTANYVPDRQTEGYGISMRSIDFAAQENFSLIIAMDCGIKANEQVEYAQKLGIDMIICDHHTPGDEIPKAVAVLDPKRDDCPYPYKELSGCGIAFKVICALAQQSEKLRNDPFKYIDLVAVSIASDIVPLTGENRVLAHFGLKKLNEQPTQGIEKLKLTAGYTKEYDITDVVFKIGPRINAAGRIEHAKKAVELLIGTEIEDLDVLGKKINDLNNLRKEIEQTTVEECLRKIAAEPLYEKSVTTVIYGDNWHKGVIGIVASKLIETYYKPTVVLAKSEEGFAVGSARSVEGFNLYKALNECAFLFEKFGGHKAAAGLTIAYDKIEEFQTVFDDVVRSQISADLLVPKVWYDQEISTSNINWNLFNNLERMGPFGPKNMRPCFVSRNVEAQNVRLLGGKHLKFSIYQPHSNLDCIAFNFGHIFEILKENPLVDICYNIEVNEWQGNRFLQLNIKDLKHS